MDALNTDVSPASMAEAPYDVVRPAAGARPLIFASPHSGRLYPDAMMAASALDHDEIRRSEDAHVDDLIRAGADFGASLLFNRYARAYVDVNRDARELDATMFSDALPEDSRSDSARVAAGLGAIARVVADGQEIYSRKLTFAEARDRIEAVYRPWHASLQALIGELRDEFGRVTVIDWHSMPSAAARTAQGQICDFVLGDRFGRACAGELTETAEEILGGLGYRVMRNTPYAGGYTTEHYGKPSEGVSVLQIEINRALYFDEASLTLNAGFDTLKRDLQPLFAAFAKTA